MWRQLALSLSPFLVFLFFPYPVVMFLCGSSAAECFADGKKKVHVVVKSVQPAQKQGAWFIVVVVSQGAVTTCQESPLAVAAIHMVSAHDQLDSFPPVPTILASTPRLLSARHWRPALPSSSVRQSPAPLRRRSPPDDVITLSRAE